MINTHDARMELAKKTIEAYENKSSLAGYEEIVKEYLYYVERKKEWVKMYEEVESEKPKPKTAWERWCESMKD